MRKPKKPEQPKPIHINAARFKKILARSREAAARQEQRLIQHQKLERERLKSNHSLSGEILPQCVCIPLEDLAARWKRSPAMLIEAAENGLFDVVITEHAGIRDFWYLSPSRWPYRDKSSFSPSPRTVHSLFPVGSRFSASARLYFPSDEITRIEKNLMQLPDAAAVVSPKWGTVKEAAAHYDRSEKTIRNWIAKDKIETKTLPSGRRNVRLN